MLASTVDGGNNINRDATRDKNTQRYAAWYDAHGLTLSHLVALAKVKDAEKRKQLAEETIQMKYSVRALKEVIDNRTGKKASEESPEMLREKLMKKLASPRKLREDKTVIELLSDTKRLEEAFNEDEALEIVKKIKEVTKPMDEDMKFLSTLRQKLYPIAARPLMEEAPATENA